VLAQTTRHLVAYKLGDYRKVKHANGKLHGSRFESGRVHAPKNLPTVKKSSIMNRKS
jgi:hypothetical protein